MFFILPVSWTQWTTKYLNEHLIVRDNLSVLDWANNCKVDMASLEQYVLKIVEAQRELPLLSLGYFKKPAAGRFSLTTCSSINCILSSPFLLLKYWPFRTENCKYFPIRMTSPTVQTSDCGWCKTLYVSHWQNICTYSVSMYREF